MTTEKTHNPSNPDEARTPEEVTDFNDRVWDMVLRKIHVVALYVLLQIVMVSLFQTHPAYRSWTGWVYVGQFFGAWTVFYGTLLRDMGFRCRSGFVLFILTVLSLVAAGLTDPRAWSDGWVRGLLAIHMGASVLLWCVTIVRWRILKRQFLKAQSEGILP